MNNPPELAMSMNNFGIRLAEVGRRAEALDTGQEAVTVRRELVRLDPDAHLPDLARSVHNLSIHLAAVGRRAEALDTAEEAANYYSELDDHYPGIFDSSRGNNQKVIGYLANQKTTS